MIRCKICVMPDTRPDSEFVDGVCSACIAYQNRPAIDWDLRKKQLVDLLESHRRKGAEFDCIVPSSGGKDSTYQVLKLIELGAKPLVVTATTCHLTDIGRKNIDNLARYATTIEVSPNKSVRRILNRAGLELVGDISWPEHVAIFTTPFKVAEQMDIPLMFYGENPQNQYGGPLDSQDARVMTRRWVSEFGGFLGLRPRDLIGSYGLKESDLLHYVPNLPSQFMAEAHFLGQYLPWYSHENAKVALAAGMEKDEFNPTSCNWWDCENLDNAQTGLHDHMMYRKYGYGRGCAQASVDVRSGKVDRAFALRFVQYRDGEFPFVYMGVQLQDILEPIGVSDAQLCKIMAQFTNQDLFDGEKNRRPILKAEHGQI